MTIINNMTQITSNVPIVEYVFAFDVMLRGYAIPTILIGILIVLVVAIYFWREDFVFATTNASYIVGFGAFIMTLTKSSIFVDSSGDPLRLLTFTQFSAFLVILALLVFYSQVSEK